MTLLRPLFMQKTGADPDITYSATNYRLSLIYGLLPYEGCIDPVAGNSLNVSQRAAGANFSVDVAPGLAVILGDDVSLQGSYLCASDAVTNIATPGAPGSGTRVHRLVARIKDKLNNGTWTTYEWAIELLQDTGSGTPAEPASAVTLALISIAAGQGSVTNAHITDRRPWARPALSASANLVAASGWSAADATRPPSFKVTADGFVHLYGWLQKITSSLSATGGTFFQLASGLTAPARPGGNRDGLARTSAGSGFCGILNQATGVVSFVFPATTTINVNDWISLDGISFRL